MPNRHIFPLWHGMTYHNDEDNQRFWWQLPLQGSISPTFLSIFYASRLALILEYGIERKEEKLGVTSKCVNWQS